MADTKSREEYEKSIYAKRDALIMKKKQRIATATSLQIGRAHV